VTIEIEAGECLAIIGESGSGKTTLLRSFNRMTEPDSGAVYIGDRAAREIDPVYLRRHTGYVPQDGGLLPHWRVRRNVGLVPWLLGVPDPAAAAEEALALVGLDPRTYGERWPHTLSGGQRQRVSIARAMAGKLSVWLLDEPFGALDAITRAELHESFRSLRGKLAITAVLVTHDLDEAIELGDRVAVLRNGRLEQVASPSVLQKTPATPYVAALLARARAR